LLDAYLFAIRQYVFRNTIVRFNDFKVRYLITSPLTKKKIVSRSRRPDRERFDKQYDVKNKKTKNRDGSTRKNNLDLSRRLLFVFFRR